MKRLVLFGEGQGECSALPILVDRILTESGGCNHLYVDRDVFRVSPAKLVRWDRAANRPDYSEWLLKLEAASRRRDLGGILAIYDGDAKMFPGGSGLMFCAKSAAKMMAAAANQWGAGRIFSVSIVFACTEYETWLVAGLESLRGRQLAAGRIVIPSNVCFPAGPVEAHGKGWLEQNLGSYLPTRDQAELTRLVSLDSIRQKRLRSFDRLEHAINQLIEAAANGLHVCTPQ